MPRIPKIIYITLKSIRQFLKTLHSDAFLEHVSAGTGGARLGENIL